VLEPPEGLGVEDPVTVALERGAQVVGWLGTRTTSAIRRPERRGREPVELLGLAYLAGADDEGWRAQVQVSTGVGRV
jgi:hypothetical protein